MIILRWQAKLVPNKEQIIDIFKTEGLDPLEEILNPSNKIKDHRHPFDEVRMIVSGALFMNISGTQILLRAGDRIEIPANTKHSKQVDGNEDCICVVAQKAF